MKKTLFPICLLLVAAIVNGQAHEGAVDFQKAQHPAAVIELPYTPDVVNAAMNEYLSKKGRSRGTDLKGFTTFRNTQSVQADSVNADLYFKVERKSRKDKEVSIVSLLLTSPASVTASTSNLRHLNMEQAKTYLNELVPAIEAHNLELRIKDQNEAVAKAESKYKNLSEEGTDLEKRKVAIDKKIEDNKKEQQAQLDEVANQKQLLANWVSQRRS